MMMIYLSVFAILFAGSAEAKPMDFEIVGEVQKPEVTVVISRENLNKSYDLRLEESFLQKILDSVKKPPF
jgi:hypothetical protein